MDRSGPAVWRACSASLVIACGTLLAPQAQAQAQDAGRHRAAATQRPAVDEIAIKAELRRMVEQRKRELRPEYERRVREDGKPSADRWLRETAAELGRRDGADIRARYGL